jgi:DNA processing protein
MSEMPLGWEPRGRDFPRRNRIVSGLALATVVIEAARRSGSLITARFANEQGREVFAVPGSPLDPRAEGCNDLLRNGATLCTRGADVIEALMPIVAVGATPRSSLFDDHVGFPSAERLWDETDLFGDPAIPLTDAARELDDDGGQAALFQRDAVATVATPENANELITQLLGASPVSIDDLVRTSGLPVAVVQATLFDLELSGVLVRTGANLVARAQN